MQLEGPTQNYRSWLLEELTRRKKNNPSYSLRAFARDLGVSTTALSDVLSAKRHFSKKNVVKIADRLSLSPKIKENLILQISTRESEILPDSEFLRIQEDTFAIISDWHYYAILNLAKIKNTKAEEKSLAKRLGISDWQVREALQRLERMGFVEIRNSVLVRTAKTLTTLTDIPSAALRKHHKQQLQLATEALDKVPVHAREISSVTMAINPSRIAEAKKKIVHFRRRLAKFLEGGELSQVYTFSVQLFPLTQQGESE